MADQPDLYTQLAFPVLPQRPYVIINMVATVDGKATIHGRAHGIGDAHDHTVMQQLRLHADAVMSGSGTLVKEDIIPTLDERWRQQRQAAGRPPLPLAVTLTSHNQFDWSKHFFDPANRPHIFFTGADAGELAQHAAVLPVQAANPLPDVMQQAKTRLGINLLLVEGGPLLNYSLLQAQLADELFVTVSPKLSGLRGLTIVEGETELGFNTRLLSSYHLHNELFLRYRLRPAAADV